MGPKPKYRNCRCSLETYPHQVPEAQWNAHKEEHRASLVDATTHAVLSEANAGSSPVPDQSQFTTEALKSLAALISERTTQPKQPTRQAQSDALLKSVLEGIEKAVIAIQEAKSASQNVELQRKKMNEALDEVLLAARSLRPFKESPEKTFVAGRLTDLELLVKDLRSTLPEDTAPLFYDSAYATENPIADLEVMAQVMILFGLVCNVQLNLAADTVDFILGTAKLLIKSAMALNAQENADGSHSFDALQEKILEELPSSLYVAMSRLNLDGKIVMYAACPSCDHIHAPALSAFNHPSWPAKCENTIVGKEGRSICSAALLTSGKGPSRPIKPFLSPCFLDYLARLVSNPETERMLDEACDVAVSETLSDTDFVKDVFQAEFLKTFKDRDGIDLFINRGGKRMRLVFAISMDFFPPFGSRKRSNSNSIGLIYIYCLNLKLSVRHNPENVHVSIIPGLSTPHKEQINPYLRPTIDAALLGWNRGIHLSTTGTQPATGRIVDLAFVLAANDLPAARQLAGAAAHNAHIYCTCCECRGRSTVYNTDFENWVKRNVDELRGYAEAWRDANTQAERDAIYKAYGVRWSEMWRLPYWDPCRMLVVDPMHCVLEGLVHYHSREVLQLNLGDATKTIKSAPAYLYNFPSLDTEVPDKCKLKPPQEKHVLDIYKLLVHQLCDDAPSENGDSDGDSDENDNENEDDNDIDDKDKPKPKASDDDKDELTPGTLSAKLAKKYKPSLVFVCWILELPTVVPSVVPRIPRKNAKTPRKKKTEPAQKKPDPLSREEYLVRQTRAQLADLLVDWRLGKPLRDETGNLRTQSKAIDKASLRFVQDVIANTTVPAWVNHVPKNYGEKGAGSIKADEWRLLGTIYLPIALVILWGEQSQKAELLKQSMALFQATTIVCRFGTSPERASAFRNHLKEWVDKLYSCHPHTTVHKKRTNVHVAFHIYDFLLLFGPVLSWWCFPIERLIGVLQKINSNNHVGGEHEATVLRTWMRGANL
ncbi:Glycoside hydrolase family 92 protein [Mycena venus]|uniref:Glycoside hydrolase family 92 protein n=1 Tax=Mycena venus TaxID=2733690 RepID=A0A8H6X3L5_9AGAR|nr:Glycoside hydrolase family 92 protein [Mycena venus]